jgi:hypothetical protein
VLCHDVLVPELEFQQQTALMGVIGDAPCLDAAQIFEASTNRIEPKRNVQFCIARLRSDLFVLLSISGASRLAFDRNLGVTRGDQAEQQRRGARRWRPRPA